MGGTDEKLIRQATLASFGDEISKAYALGSRSLSKEETEDILRGLVKKVAKKADRVVDDIVSAVGDNYAEKKVGDRGLRGSSAKKAVRKRAMRQVTNVIKHFARMAEEGFVKTRRTTGRYKETRFGFKSYTSKRDKKENPYITSKEFGNKSRMNRAYSEALEALSTRASQDRMKVGVTRSKKGRPNYGTLGNLQGLTWGDESKQRSKKGEKKKIGRVRSNKQRKALFTILSEEAALHKHNKRQIVREREKGKIRASYTKTNRGTKAAIPGIKRVALGVTKPLSREQYGASRKARVRGTKGEGHSKLKSKKHMERKLQAEVNKIANQGRDPRNNPAIQKRINSGQIQVQRFGSQYRVQYSETPESQRARTSPVTGIQRPKTVRRSSVPKTKRGREQRARAARRRRN